MPQRYEQVTVTTRAEWRAWLAEHHASSPGIWLVRFKKKSGGPYIEYGDLVEEALAFGWVDSQAKTLDDERSVQLMTPRRPKSNWSASNKERVERLTAAGLMAPAGLRAVETAKGNGSWTQIDSAQRLEEPDDLRAALDGRAEARGHWDAFPPSTRRAILEWIGAAKRPETRAKRVTETAELAARDVRANQWRPKG